MFTKTYLAAERQVSVSCASPEQFDNPVPPGGLRLALLQKEGAFCIEGKKGLLPSGTLLLYDERASVSCPDAQYAGACSLTLSPVTRDGEERQFSPDNSGELRFPACRIFYEYGVSLPKGNGQTRVLRGVLLPAGPAGARVSAVFAQAVREMRECGDEGWRGRAQFHLLDLLRMVRQEYLYGQNADPTASPSGPAVRVLGHIHANYPNEVTLSALCERFHTNHTSLLREFRRLTGTTVGQYLLEYRLEAARESLLLTPLTVEEVAVRCGFRQAAYFSRAFRRRYGLAPGKYRRLARLEGGAAIVRSGETVMV